MQKDFCCKKVFAIGNIELVRVESSNSAEMNLQEVLFWFPQKNRATSCHSGNTKGNFLQRSESLCSRKTKIPKCPLEST